MNLKTNVMKRILLSIYALGALGLAEAQPGSLDQNFADGAVVKTLNFLEPEEEWLTHMVVDDQDRIWIAGSTFQNNDWALLLVRLTPDGNYDMSFGDGGYAVLNVANNNLERVGGLALHNNHLIIAGDKTAGGVTNQFVLKYTEDGFLDASFGSLGFTDLPFQATATDVTVDNLGNIFISGVYSDNVTVTKLFSNGTADQSFGLAGVTLADFPSADESTAIAVDNLGQIFVFGHGELNGVVRGQITSFLPNGAPNTNFTGNSRKSITWPDSKDFMVADGILNTNGSRFFLAGNTINPITGEFNAAMVAVNVNSSQDLTFGLNGWFELDASIGGDEMITQLAEHTDGIYLSMVVQESPSGISSVVAHINDSGSLIESFGNFGIADYNIIEQGDDQGLDFAFQSDGKLLLCGIALGENVSGYAVRINTSTTTGIESANNRMTLSIYPNPATSQLSFSLNRPATQGENYRILSANGQLIQQGTISSATGTIDISSLIQGYYLITIGNSVNYFIKTN
jgi:uncharacterized delta-60 repeat protein